MGEVGQETEKVGHSLGYQEAETAKLSGKGRTAGRRVFSPGIVIFKLFKQRLLTLPLNKCPTKLMC